MLREMVQETRLSARDFVYPLFVTHGRNVQLEIAPMPGMYQLSLDRLLPEISTVVDLGIPAVLLFGIPRVKDAEGSEAHVVMSAVQRAAQFKGNCRARCTCGGCVWIVSLWIDYG